MTMEGYMARKGRLIIIAAPSGAGKTSVIKKFLAKHPNMIHSVSCTTRPMRPGEVDHRDYHFISRETFEEWRAGGRLAEWNQVHENFYGTPKAPIDEAIAKGIDVLLDLDVIGSLNLKKLYGDVAISIFLLPPSMEEAKRRLTLRGTDSKEVQALRLKNAIEEMKYKDKFDYRVVNDVLDRACAEIEDIISRG
jgi:guanylate kinase